MTKRLAQFESSQGHIVIVYDDAKASLIGRSGNSLDYSYISSDREILKTVASDLKNALCHLNGGTFFKWVIA